MAVMTHEFSRFPERLYTLHDFENVADAPSSVMAIIAEIKKLVTEGKYEDATTKLEENKSTLTRYWIDADIVNAIEEEIRNLEIYARSIHQAYYCQSEKPDANEGDVWISE